MVNWLAEERVKAALRHTVACPIVTGRTERAESKARMLVLVCLPVLISHSGANSFLFGGHCRRLITGVTLFCSFVFMKSLPNCSHIICCCFSFVVRFLFFFRMGFHVLTTGYFLRSGYVEIQEYKGRVREAKYGVLEGIARANCHCAVRVEEESSTCITYLQGRLCVYTQSSLAVRDNDATFCK